MTWKKRLSVTVYSFKLEPHLKQHHHLVQTTDWRSDEHIISQHYSAEASNQIKWIIFQIQKYLLNVSNFQGSVSNTARRFEKRQHPIFKPRPCFKRHPFHLLSILDSFIPNLATSYEKCTIQSEIPFQFIIPPRHLQLVRPSHSHSHSHSTRTRTSQTHAQ